MYDLEELRNEVMKSNLPIQVFAYYLLCAKEKGLIIKTNKGYKFKLFRKKKFIKYMKEKETEWKEKKELK